MTVAQQLADGGVVLRETVPSSDVVRARFGDVDGLRAFAIVAIVAYQTVRFVGLPARIPPAVAQLFSDASQGFSLFLMLSAFSLAYPIVAACRTDGATYLDIGRYAVKRLLRIYPAFLAVLAIAFAIHPLAVAFRWTAIANAVPALPLLALLRNAVFLDGGFGGFADGTGNDGFTALALVARGFILLPIALFGWLHAPRLTLAAAILAAALDVLTPAHAFTLSAALPLVLGIVAADMRVQHHRLQRFGLPLALAAGLLAFFLGPNLETMAGTVAAPDALRVDPFWSIALFGLVAAVGFSGRLERLLGFPPLRLLGTAAYGISLVAMPVAALATRTLPERLGFGALAASTAAEEFGLGIVVWLAVDRWFSGDGLRRRAADGLGAWLDGILAKWHASRIVFAAPSAEVPGEPEPVELRVAPSPAFYAPPPRPATDIPVFSTRTGSADELAAEILQTKARLGERSAAVLDPEPRPAAPDADPYAKPGFYRRPPQPASASTGRRSTTAVATPIAVSPVAAPPIAPPPTAASPIAASPIAASPIAATVPANAPSATSSAQGLSLEASSDIDERTAGMPSLDGAVSSTIPTATGIAGATASPATAAPVTAMAAAAGTTAASTATADVRADAAAFEAGHPAIGQTAIDAEREGIVAVEAPLMTRTLDAAPEMTVEPPPAEAMSAAEPAFATSADIVHEPDSASPDVVIPTRVAAIGVERPREAPPADPAPDVWARAVELAVETRRHSTPSDDWFRAAKQESPFVAPPSVPLAPPSVSPASVAPPPVAPPSDAFAGPEPARERPATTYVDERTDDEPSVSGATFRSSYDGESPLEMLRAAYPPIDEPASIGPEPIAVAPPAVERSQGHAAFRLSAEPAVPPYDVPGTSPLAGTYDIESQRQSLSAAEPPANPPSANEPPSAANALPLDVAPSPAPSVFESFAPGADRTTATSTVPPLGGPSSVGPAPTDDPILQAPEASAATFQTPPVPAAPLQTAFLQTAELLGDPLAAAPLAPAPAQAAPSAVVLRPIVKASLLVRVFKHARAKFKPVVSSAPAAPAGVSASPPIPSGVPVPSAARSASAPAPTVAEAPATKHAAASTAPAGTKPFAHATPPPGRQSIRMRIGPPRVSRSDGDNG